MLLYVHDRNGVLYTGAPKLMVGADQTAAAGEEDPSGHRGRSHATAGAAQAVPGHQELPELAAARRVLPGPGPVPPLQEAGAPLHASGL